MPDDAYLDVCTVFMKLLQASPVSHKMCVGCVRRGTKKRNLGGASCLERGTTHIIMALWLAELNKTGHIETLGQQSK